MFESCKKLTSIDVKNFKTSKVTDMQKMFSNCRELTNFNISNFYTSLVRDMNNMFELLYN